jgi:hypothetical protein
LGNPFRFAGITMDAGARRNIYEDGNRAHLEESTRGARSVAEKRFQVPLSILGKLRDRPLPSMARDAFH